MFRAKITPVQTSTTSWTGYHKVFYRRYESPSRKHIYPCGDICAKLITISQDNLVMLLASKTLKANQNYCIGHYIKMSCMHHRVFSWVKRLDGLFLLCRILRWKKWRAIIKSCHEVSVCTWTKISDPHKSLGKAPQVRMNFWAESFMLHELALQSSHYSDSKHWPLHCPNKMIVSRWVSKRVTALLESTTALAQLLPLPTPKPKLTTKVYIVFLEESSTICRDIF